MMQTRLDDSSVLHVQLIGCCGGDTHSDAVPDEDVTLAGNFLLEDLTKIVKHCVTWQNNKVSDIILKSLVGLWRLLLVYGDCDILYLFLAKVATLKFCYKHRIRFKLSLLKTSSCYD